jgi:hypothetical protein
VSEARPHSDSHGPQCCAFRSPLFLKKMMIFYGDWYKKQVLFDLKGFFLPSDFRKN